MRTTPLYRRDIEYTKARIRPRLRGPSRRNLVSAALRHRYGWLRRRGLFVFLTELNEYAGVREEGAPGNGKFLFVAPPTPPRSTHTPAFSFSLPPALHKHTRAPVCMCVYSHPRNSTTAVQVHTRSGSPQYCQSDNRPRTSFRPYIEQSAWAIIISDRGNITFDCELKVGAVFDAWNILGTPSVSLFRCSLLRINYERKFFHDLECTRASMYWRARCMFPLCGMIFISQNMVKYWGGMHARCGMRGANKIKIKCAPAVMNINGGLIFIIWLCRAMLNFVWSFGEKLKLLLR